VAKFGAVWTFCFTVLIVHVSSKFWRKMKPVLFSLFCCYQLAVTMLVVSYEVCNQFSVRALRLCITLWYNVNKIHLWAASTSLCHLTLATSSGPGPCKAEQTVGHIFWPVTHVTHDQTMAWVSHAYSRIIMSSRLQRLPSLLCSDVKRCNLESWIWLIQWIFIV